MPRSSVAQSLKVSTRTVRTYVNAANLSLAGIAHIDSHRNRGLQLVVEDERAFSEMLIERTDTATHPSTPQERIDYLLQDLLLRSSWVTLEDYSRELYVSRATLSGELAVVEQRLNEFGLALERRSHYGIRVTGTEAARRNCLASHSLQPYVGTSAATIDEVKGLVEEVSGCLADVLDANDLRVRHFVWHNLVVHLAIAIMRISRNCYVPLDSSTLQEVERSRGFDTAKQLAEVLEQHFSIELPEAEVVYIALHLAGKEELPQLPSSGSSETSLVISDEVVGIVSEMLEAVRERHGYDLSQDLELFMNLARHVIPLTVRLNHQMTLHNPLIEDIRTHYPLALSLARTAARILEDHYGNPMSDDECGYLALAFELALERQRTGRPKKNILIVCATGAGSARLLKYQYEREFGDCIEKAYACDVSSISDIDFSHIDYTFTTVHIDQPLPVPVIEVTYFLTEDSVRDIRSILSAPGTEERGFDPQLFFPHLSFGSKEEALHFLCEKVRATGEVPDTFESLVLAREQMGSTAFGNSIALPHAAENVANSTFACVGVLDEPLDWDGRPVRVIMLVAAQRQAQEQFDDFIRHLLQIISNKAAVDQLAESQSYLTLLEILRN